MSPCSATIYLARHIPYTVLGNHIKTVIVQVARDGLWLVVEQTREWEGDLGVDPAALSFWTGASFTVFLDGYLQGG